LIRDTVLLVDPIRFDRSTLRQSLVKVSTKDKRKLTQDESEKIFCGHQYSDSFPDSGVIANRRQGNFERLAPSDMCDIIVAEAKSVVSNAQ
jgi:hypothetical protein